MNKKFLVLLRLCVVIVSMSSACAFDLNSVSDLFINNGDATNVTISGIDFNIPSGFTEALNESVENQTTDNPYINYSMSSKTFLNVDGDAIEIAVSGSDDVQADDDFAKEAAMGGNKTTINGVDGYEFSDIDFNGFTFAKDGKLVILLATNKELLNDVVVA